MIRNIKMLGVAVLAVMAVGAFSAASASAAAEFHSEASHTELRGTQVGEDTFTVNAGTVRCAHATYSGTQAASTTPHVTVLPEYTSCKAFGFVNATIHTNGCGYTFSVDGETVGTEGTGKVYIECPANKVIEVTAFNCWVTVGTQGPLPGVKYHNTGAGNTRDVDVNVNLTGIHYTQHSKSFPGCNSGTRTDGTYTGTATVQGFNTTNEQIGVWVH